MRSGQAKISGPAKSGTDCKPTCKSIYRMQNYQINWVQTANPPGNIRYTLQKHLQKSGTECKTTCKNQVQIAKNLYFSKNQVQI